MQRYKKCAIYLFPIVAPHELFALEHYTNQDFYSLNSYYASFTPADSNLFNTANGAKSNHICRYRLAEVKPASKQAYEENKTALLVIWHFYFMFFTLSMQQFCKKYDILF